MVASILKVIITRSTICDNLVGFPKSGHIMQIFIYISIRVSAKFLFILGIIRI